MRVSERHIAGALLLFSLLVRFWGVGDLSILTGDEIGHVPGSRNYMERGQLTPGNWQHPPLKQILMYTSIKILGDNPYGWRIKNVLMGGFSVLVLFLIARQLFDERVAYLGALLLSLDPLHILTSRSSYEDVQAVFFLLLSIYWILRYLRGDSSFLVAAGVSLGLAIATKWYYLPTAAALLIFVLTVKLREDEKSLTGVVYLLMALVVLPLSTYLLTFFAWFGRGFDLPDFFEMQIDAYRDLQAARMGDYGSFFSKMITPAEWFIKPSFLVATSSGNGEWRRFLIFMNNPPAQMLTLPAIAYMGYQGIKLKSRPLFMVFVLFLATYSQFLFVHRPIFLYTSLCVLPFAYLAVASSAVSLVTRRLNEKYYWGILAAVAAWGIYLYPLAVRLPVPAWLYAPVLFFVR